MRIVGISDTHTREPFLPDGDLLIHSGDLGVFGFRVEICRQLLWLEEQVPKYPLGVLVIPGNHDLFLEKHFAIAEAACKGAGITLLHNSQHVLANGLKVWGSGHTPDFHSWAFMLGTEEIRQAWNLIPDNTDLLVTHGPPQGILDRAGGQDLGCPELLKRVRMVKPKVHQFGHIHEGWGSLDYEGTHFMNCATRPLVYDLG